jgi:hypothetical protein
MRELLEPALTSFVIHGPQHAESVARSLIRAWLTATHPEPRGPLVEAFNVLVDAATGSAWGESRHWAGKATINVTLEMLTMCVDRVPREAVEQWLLQIVKCDQFTDEHIALATNCMVRCDPGGLPEVEDWLAGGEYRGNSARYQVMELICLAELAHDPGDVVFELTEEQVEALRTDRGLANRYRALGRALPGD